MRKRTRLLISMPVLFMIIGAIFLAGKPELSSAQDDGFKMYQLLVFCDNRALVSAIFGYEVTQGGTVGRPLMGTKSRCVGKCGGGTVPLADALAGLPARVSADLQAQVDKHQADAAAGKGSRLTCLGDGKEKSPEDKKPKCEPKTPPWFDTGAKCDDPMMFPPVPSVRAEPHLGAVTCSISYTVCGFLMSEPRAKYFSTGPPNFFSRMSQEEADEFCTAKGFGRDTVPFRLTCCKKWNQAFTDWIAFRRQHGPDAPGHPCTPSIDADCDGIPNFQDPTPIGDCAEYPGRPSPSP